MRVRRLRCHHLRTGWATRSPNDIRVVSRHQVLLVEGNYLLLGAFLAHLPTNGASSVLSPRG